MDHGDATTDTCTGLSELLTLRRDATSSGVPCLYGHLPLEVKDVAAVSLACGIVTRRLPSTRLRRLWHGHATGQTRGLHRETDRRVMEAALLENVGTPTAPADTKHLLGLVAESIWVDVVSEADVGLGRPVRVEGHDWSVTDPGGDGLTIYAVDGQFCYRLWESKYHGRDEEIRSTINAACRQVESRASSYLSRFSLVAQHLTNDDPLAVFLARLTELWVDKDPAAGVGIVVSTNDPLRQVNCFEGIDRHFGLVADQHQGHLNLIGDFPVFAKSVRRVLWKGCGLWIGP